MLPGTFSGSVPLDAPFVIAPVEVEFIDPGAVSASMLVEVGETMPLQVTAMSHQLQVAAGVLTVGWAWAAAASARPSARSQ